MTLGGEKVGGPSMVIKYWGVRGSIPAPLTTQHIMAKEKVLIEGIIKAGGTQKLFGDKPDPEAIQKYLNSLPLSISGTYGGDTTCLEIQAHNSPLILIDAGSGARALGNVLLGKLFSGKNLNPLDSNEERKRSMDLFFTHYHWDHIQGFPFFAPAFIPGDIKLLIHFYGKRNAKVRLSHVLQGQQEYPHFPVEWEAMPCEKSYKELGRMAPVDINVGAAIVKYAELDHPDRILGYSIEIDNKKFVCGTDTEHRDVEDPVLCKLANNADILYYDSQYTPEEYSGRKGISRVRWGHSTYEWAIKTALKANVRIVVLGHHDPSRDDFEMEELEEKAHEYRNSQLKLPENEGKKLEVVVAYQGLEQEL